MRSVIAAVGAVLLCAGLALAGPDDELVTLNFQDAEAMSVLEFFARVTGKAFVPEDELKIRVSVIAPGPVTKRTALDLLDAVLALKGYGLIEREDYFKVVRRATAAREALRGSSAQTPSDRFVTEVLELRHVAADGVHTELRQLLSPEGSMLVNRPLNLLIVTDTAISIARVRGLLAELDKASRAPLTKLYTVSYAPMDKLEPVLRGIFARETDPASKPTLTMSADSRQIVASGLPSFHQELAQVLKTLDRRPRQVMIEVTIVEVSLEDSSRMGVEWQWEDTYNTVEHDALRINSTSLLGGLAGLKYSIVKPDELKALVHFFAQTEKAEILSNPHLVTLDGKEARLTVGEEIPLLREFRLDQNNNPIRTFDQQKVGINTAITPVVTTNGDVLLAVRQEVSNVLSVNTQDFTSRIGQRIAETNVMVRDGHTLVIGGLIRDEMQAADGGVPLLKDIPLLGALFSTRSLEPSKAELLILITPRVIETPEEADRTTEDRKQRHPGTLDVSGDEFRL